MNWQEQINKEKEFDIVKDLGDKWWLLEFKPKTPYSYHGIVGSYYITTKKFIAIHDPAARIAYTEAQAGYQKDKNTCFTDGRQIKWIAGSFIPPLAKKYSIARILEIGALTKEEIDQLEAIHFKLNPLFNNKSEQYKQALKLAKTNRDMLQKKYGVALKRPPFVPTPKHVTATLNLLNGDK